MNDSEQQRILQMVADGTISSEEARSLLAAISQKTKDSASPPLENSKSAATEPKQKEKPVEVQMQRADGTTYTVQLPPNLIPMFWEVAKVAIKESARNAAQETVAGLKVIAKNKSSEFKAAVKNRMSGTDVGLSPSTQSMPVPRQGEARRQVLQMVANGRITAADASRLIEQLEAVEARRKQTEPSQFK